MISVVNDDALLTCSMAMAPLPQKVVLFVPKDKILTGGKSMANIMNNKPMMEIPSFKMCKSPSNPLVMAATAAAMGVLTPAPCMPMFVGPWLIGNPKVLIGSMPALNKSHKIMCAYGGCVSVLFSGSSNVMHSS